MTSSETTNITACVLAKQLGAKRTIARISNTEFLENKDEVGFTKFGIDELISPEALASNEIELLLNQSAFNDTYEFEEENDELREVKSTYIHVPLLLKLSTKRINNFKPFIVMGVSRSINLASNEKNPEDNFEGQFRMRRSTGYYELGFGIDLYLYYFKFTPSIRGVFATSDELVPDDSPFSPWTSNISSLKTRGIFLNFTFQ